MSPSDFAGLSSFRLTCLSDALAGPLEASEDDSAMGSAFFKRASRGFLPKHRDLDSGHCDGKGRRMTLRPKLGSPGHSLLAHAEIRM